MLPLLKLTACAADLTKHTVADVQEDFLGS